MADGLASNGSRDGGMTDGIIPPPYMPSLDLEAGGREGRTRSRTSLERWGKDQEFPGLR
jgi:hypothetical protein